MLQKLGYASLLPVLIGLVACTKPPAADQSTVTPTPSQPAARSSTSQTTSPTDTIRSAPANQPDVLQDAVVVPGERVGPVTSTTSRANLASLFGEDKLIDQEVNVGEGMMQPGTVVNLGPDEKFTIVWTDQTRSKPQMVKDFGTHWRTPEGLGVGSSLAELKDALGDFKLYGFGWDYSGTVVLENTKLNDYHGDLILRLQPPEDRIEQHHDAYEALQGDATFESANPNLQVLNPIVYDMTVYLNPRQ